MNRDFQKLLQQGWFFGVSETPFQRLLGALVTKHIQEGTE